MDETPMFFDTPNSKTYDFGGVKTVRARLTGYEKLRYSAVLCGGTMIKEQMVVQFLAKLLNRRHGAFFGNPKTLLIMDTAAGHLGDEVKLSFKEKNIDILNIGGGLTSILQFIDTHVNKSLKSKARELWEAWLPKGEMEYTRTGKRKRASYEIVAEWVSHAWSSIATNDYTMKGFK